MLYLKVKPDVARSISAMKRDPASNTTAMQVRQNFLKPLSIVGSGCFYRLEAVQAQLTASELLTAIHLCNMYCRNCLYCIVLYTLTQKSEI